MFGMICDQLLRSGATPLVQYGPTTIAPQLSPAVAKIEEVDGWLLILRG